MKRGRTMSELINITVKDLTVYLCQLFNIKQNALARMIEVTEATLSNNLEKNINEVSTKKLGKRLLPLFLVVDTLDKSLLDPKVILGSLQEQVIPNFVKGFNDTILEAIVTEGLTNVSVLIEFADKAVDTYRLRKKNTDERIRNAVKEALTA